MSWSEGSSFRYNSGMDSKHAVIIDEVIFIPKDAFSFDGFQDWCFSDAFPETGRIDYLGGTIELELNQAGTRPEDLFTHNAVRSEIGARLHILLSDQDLGEVFSKGARVVAPEAQISFEPDLAVVFQQSLETGRVRYTGISGGVPERLREIEGAPDLIVEVLSDTSSAKDSRRLPSFYAQAGIPELWLIDARGEDLRFDVHELEDGQYRRLDADPERWILSPCLGRVFRLIRRSTQRPGVWRYNLEVRQPAGQLSEQAKFRELRGKVAWGNESREV